MSTTHLLIPAVVVEYLVESLLVTGTIYLLSAKEVVGDELGNLVIS